jgi:carbonic anhydrase/acetyltransferase-like protein (isoleucine patch superfamily)
MIEPFAGRLPEIDATAWVHPTAVLIGDVRLGPNASVWPTAVLRGDMGPIEIGAWSNVQDGTICHDTGGLSATRVGERVTIGHRVILHGCTIGDDCLIGMAAVIMDMAVIGAGSLVAAGTLIPPRKEFPPGSVIQGSPGRLIRQVTDSDRAMIDHGWRAYSVAVAGYAAR